MKSCRILSQYMADSTNRISLDGQISSRSASTDKYPVKMA